MEIADRFSLQEVLGRGASGTVWRAHDAWRESTVALKLWEEPSVQAPRWRREVSTLGALDLPGVCRIVAHGLHEDRPYVAMELVEGSPFPGVATPCTWEAIEHTVLMLLDNLDSVHQAGFVHRDIKPSNVLVDDAGDPTILDFGLARRSDGGDTMTQAGRIVGTPAYMAPEVLLGGRPGVRADLYAVGAMVFEALTGRVPHEDTTGSFVVARCARLRANLDSLKGVPDRVRRAVGACLEPEPTERPVDAASVRRAVEPELGRWFGPSPPPLSTQPGLLRVYAPPGAGRTAWARRSVPDTAVWIRPLHRAIALTALLPAAPSTTLGLQQLRDLVDAELHKLETRRCWIVVEDWERLDPVSVGMLRAHARRASILGLTSHVERSDRSLPRLAEPELRKLFEGPDVILHLREDAAALLQARTGGWPGLVASELARWERTKVATANERGTWSVNREALTAEALSPVAPIHSPPTSEDLPREAHDLLGILVLGGDLTKGVLIRASALPRWTVEAILEEMTARGLVEVHDQVVRVIRPSAEVQARSPEARQAAHRALARALDGPGRDRWGHMVRAGLVDEAGWEALALGEAMWTAGQLPDAYSLVRRTLQLVMSDGSIDVEAKLHELHAFHAFSLASPAAMDEARRTLLGSDRVQDDELARLLEAAAMALRGQGVNARTILEDLSEVGGEREIWAWTFRAAATRSQPAATALLEHRAMKAWAEAAGTMGHRARVDSWLGLLAYQRGEFKTAVERLGRAVQVPRRRLTGSLGVRLNYGLALIEVGRHDEAIDVGRECCQSASDARLPLYEARAWAVIRLAEFRVCDTFEPRRDLVEAALMLPQATARATLCLTEACFAFRAGNMEDAGRWSLAGSDAYDEIALLGASAFLLALAHAAGQPLSKAQRKRMLYGLQESTPGFQLQAAALLKDTEEFYRRRYHCSDSETRLELFSPAEADQWLSARESEKS